MSNATAQTQRQSAPTAAAQHQQPNADFQRLLEKPNERSVEYVPFGAADKIKLSVDIVQKILCGRTAKGEVCSVRDAIRFIMMCQAKRLNPFEGDAFIIGYDTRDGAQFSLITAHQAFLKRAEVHGEYDGMESGIVIQYENGELVDLPGDFHLPGDTVVGGWAKVHFKNRKIPTYRRLRLARFNKGRSLWNDDPAGMICKCAEADALRSSFPTMLGGLYLQGEVQFEVTADDLRSAVVPAKRGNGDASSLVREVQNFEPRTVDAVQQTERPDESAESDAGLAPAAEKKEPAPKEGSTPQVQLAELCAEHGYTFDHLQRWGVESGNIPNADSLSRFSEIPTDVARRIMRSPVGLLQGLERAKGGK